MSSDPEMPASTSTSAPLSTAVRTKVRKVIKTSIRPVKSLDLLSHREIAGLMASDLSVFQLFRECALAVLNTDSKQDDVLKVLAEHHDFDIRVVSQSRGLKLDVFNAPASAYVDGTMIRGIQEHLFSVLRDIVYTEHKISRGSKFDLQTSDGITDAVFRILRNAGVVKPNSPPRMVVCWGGHSINSVEYHYSKQVGYELGLRGLNIATGCGIGAMKGPMKGAAVGHAKQKITDGRYVGITEPGIIAAESPNPIVNELVILPDIEKRLEAFVRLAHTIIVFPGGAGTAEEVLYILSLLMHPDNKNELPLPLIFAAPEESCDYFSGLDAFIRVTLGEQACQYYEIIVGKPEEVARRAKRGVDAVHRNRRKTQEAYYYNWRLHVDKMLQTPFDPSHENMAALTLDRSLPIHELAAQLRRAFSGIVAGNVKAYGIEQIAKQGPYQITGEPEIMTALDELLRGFVEQRRMKLGTDEYQPCYCVKRSN